MYFIGFCCLNAESDKKKMSKKITKMGFLPSSFSLFVSCLDWEEYDSYQNLLTDRKMSGRITDSRNEKSITLLDPRSGNIGMYNAHVCSFQQKQMFYDNRYEMAPVLERCIDKSCTQLVIDYCQAAHNDLIEKGNFYLRYYPFINEKNDTYFKDEEDSITGQKNPIPAKYSSNRIYYKVYCDKVYHKNARELDNCFTVNEYNLRLELSETPFTVVSVNDCSQILMCDQRLQQQTKRIKKSIFYQRSWSKLPCQSSKMADDLFFFYKHHRQHYLITLISKIHEQTSAAVFSHFLLRLINSVQYGLRLAYNTNFYKVDYYALKSVMGDQTFSIYDQTFFAQPIYDPTEMKILMKCIETYQQLSCTSEHEPIFSRHGLYRWLFSKEI
jgi:hypothetical protein